jgi:hypothetical protein
MNPLESVSRSFSRYQKFDPDAVKMLAVCEPSSSKILGRPSTLFHLGLGTRLHDVCSLDNIQTYLSDAVAESTAIHFKLHAFKKEKGKVNKGMDLLHYYSHSVDDIYHNYTGFKNFVLQHHHLQSQMDLEGMLPSFASGPESPFSVYHVMKQAMVEQFLTEKYEDTHLIEMELQFPGNLILFFLRKYSPRFVSELKDTYSSVLLTAFSENVLTEMYEQKSLQEKTKGGSDLASVARANIEALSTEKREELYSNVHEIYMTHLRQKDKNAGNNGNDGIAGGKGWKENVEVEEAYLRWHSFWTLEQKIQNEFPMAPRIFYGDFPGFPLLLGTPPLPLPPPHPHPHPPPQQLSSVTSASIKNGEEDEDAPYFLPFQEKDNTATHSSTFPVLTAPREEDPYEVDPDEPLFSSSPPRFTDLGSLDAFKFLLELDTPLAFWYTVDKKLVKEELQLYFPTMFHMFVFLFMMRHVDNHTTEKSENPVFRVLHAYSFIFKDPEEFQNEYVGFIQSVYDLDMQGPTFLLEGNLETKDTKDTKSRVPPKDTSVMTKNSTSSSLKPPSRRNRTCSSLPPKLPKPSSTPPLIPHRFHGKRLIQYGRFIRWSSWTHVPVLLRDMVKTDWETFVHFMTHDKNIRNSPAVPVHGTKHFDVLVERITVDPSSEDSGKRIVEMYNAKRRTVQRKHLDRAIRARLDQHPDLEQLVKNAANDISIDRLEHHALTLKSNTLLPFSRSTQNIDFHSDHQTLTTMTSVLYTNLMMDYRRDHTLV